MHHLYVACKNNPWTVYGHWTSGVKLVVGEHIGGSINAFQIYIPDYGWLHPFSLIDLLPDAF